MVHLRKVKGATDPATLILLALIAAAAGVFGTSWKPFEFLRKKPPTQELSKLQEELVVAQAAAEQARKDKEAAVAAERNKLEQQVREAQQDNLGTQTALGRVPPVHQTPEVKLAARMAQRVEFKLAIAIGKLPEAQQKAMVELIDQALSEKQAEVDEANRKLGELDQKFKSLTGERDGLIEEVKKMEKRVKETEVKAEEVQIEVTKKTNVVSKIASELDSVRREHSSFSAAVTKAGITLFVGWLVITIIIPAFVKHMGSGPVKNFLRDVSGYLANPLPYSDAKKKIKDLSNQVQSLSNPPFKS